MGFTDEDRANFLEAVKNRIKKLAMRDDVDDFDRAGLEFLETCSSYTQRQLDALANLERIYLWHRNNQ